MINRAKKKHWVWIRRQLADFSMKAIFKRNRNKKQKKISESSSYVPSELQPVPGTSTNDDTTQQTLRAQSSKTYKDVSELSEQFLGIVKEISEANDLLSPLKSACALMIRGIQTIRNVHQNRSNWMDLCDELEGHLQQLEIHRSELQERPGDESNSCLKALGYYLSTTADLIEIAAKASEGDNKALSSIKRAGMAQMEKGELDRHRERMETAWQLYSIEMKRLIALKVNDVGDQVEAYEKADTTTMSARNTDDDGTVGPESKIAYGYRVDLCEEGTRIEILDAMRNWATNSKFTRQIFWLNDAAGTGKSTIAATMANKWSIDKRLAGRFFFSPNSRVTQTTKEFCLFVANDIARHQPSLAHTIYGEIKSISSEQHVWFDVKLQRLIIDPVGKLEGDGYVFIVVDALDNCVLSEERVGLLNSFIRHLPSAPRLKLLLTSRPVQDIADVLISSPLVHGSDLQLLNIRNSHHPDVALYVEKRLRSISSDDRAMIIARSGGLFLYAATVCRMLERTRHRTDILKIISDIGVNDKLERRMDMLYLSILKQALIDRDAGDMMMSVLSMIIVAYQPLSSNTIGRFLPGNIYVEDFVQDLGSVLKDGHPDRPIKVLHPTFREFILSNEDRANGFLLHSAQSAAEMAYACISTLEHMLEDDLFHPVKSSRLLPRNEDIKDVDRLVHKSTTAAEQYASVFWAHHVAASEISQDLLSRVTTFLSRKYLNWVEFMSWRGSIGWCIEGLSRLRRTITNLMGSSNNTQGSVIVRHAHQFLVQHQSMIIDSALQTYCMALFFTPPESPLFAEYRERYRDRQPDIITSSSVEWEDHVVLGGHSEAIDQLIFSPDGSRLISTDLNGRLQLWDTVTGGTVGKPFDDTSHGSYHDLRCTFSRIGDRFGFITQRKEVHIRYSINGEPIIPSTQLRGICYPIFSSTVSFILVAKGSSILRRDVIYGREAQLLGTGADNFSVHQIFISPNDKMIVCAGDFGDKHDEVNHATLWELDTFRPVASYSISRLSSSYYVDMNIVFSPDSSRFVICQPGCTFLLCEGQTGKQISLSQEFSSFGRIGTAIFCPYSQYFAYTDLSNSLSIIIREQKSGRWIATLKGHTQSIIHYSFSSDGRRLASISYDQTVRVWDIETGAASETIFPGFTGDIRVCGLSFDWDQLASTSAANGHQVHLYSLKGGAVGRSDVELDDITITSDHVILGTAFVDARIAVRSGLNGGTRLWDTATGVQLECVFPREYVVDVAFSPNGKLIAALTETSDIWVLNAATLKVSQSFEMTGVRHRGGGLFFSPDSDLLAVYHAGVARIWNLRTQNRLAGIPRSSPYTNIENELIKLCTISPDNARIAGVDKGDKLHVWEIGSENKAGLQTTIGRYYSQISAKFSPMEQYLLAVVKLSSEITLWRIGEELQLLTKITLPDSIPGRISFSSDGTYMAYESFCWDIVTAIPLLAYSGQSPPPFFNSTGLQAHSFLRYEDGWIYSAFPPRRLLPIPAELQKSNFTNYWHTFHEQAILIDSRGKPIVIDCSSVLAEARQK
ncbi:hypothetical protein FRC18_001145 [Serendipita sp. 400]|nr:hypothetical protein FRC18_001145 [Serendipita sp. 400]